MNGKTPRNIAASVRQRLLNKARHDSVRKGNAFQFDSARPLEVKEAEQCHLQEILEKQSSSFFFCSLPLNG
ncbi:MAG: hypothetical protein BM485_16055 [Desulfobulbaceae bacterium DB1]|nr:MAG: hypothetical protein BM485_16055 [Desulfobulbaceae bacterium DB1]